MQCPETPRVEVHERFASPLSIAYASGTTNRISHLRRSYTVHPESNRSPSYRTPKRSRTSPALDSTSNALTSRSSSTLVTEHNTNDDVFINACSESQKKITTAALQFQDAAKRLALHPVSGNINTPSLSTRKAASPTAKISALQHGSGNFPRQVVNSPRSARYLHYHNRSGRIVINYSRKVLQTPRATATNRSTVRWERDITSAKKEIYSVRRDGQTPDVTPIPKEKQRTYLTSTPNLQEDTANTDNDQYPGRVRNFSRPIWTDHPETARHKRFATPVRQSIPISRSSSFVRSTLSTEDGKPSPAAKVQSTPTLLDGSERLSHPLYEADIVTADSSNAGLHAEEPAGESTTSQSFESTAVEEVGDKRLQLKNWEIWLTRILFSLLIIGLNLGLGLAYMGAERHQYLLVILVFMKSKDVLSTIIGILSLLKNYLHNLVWSPKQIDPKWILSLVCAYAETEEQIMKTVMTLATNKTLPHKQVICIILDGKPRDILSKMSNVVITTQRPYTTWRSARGVITVNAGYVNDIPVILVEKMKNAGKKDSLVLGHDLFNFPRKDMPKSTKLLREEIWQNVLPAICVKDDFKAFDYVFCTDADSTIHENALQRLADALCRERNAIAGCGILLAELGTAKTEYSVWHLFQQFQYTFGQYVRRSAESSWGRVTCLPGCITMIVVRSEMGDAISEYAKPVTDHNLFRHQVQYLGTDRRLTWCMISQSKHLRTILVPSAMSETVVPDGPSHYLSQRRRWASNAYFNDFFLCFGPQQRLATRLFAAVDLVRLTLVFYRVFNTIYFLHGLVRRFYIIKIIPTLIVTKTPTTWYFLLVTVREPLLRKRLHKILLGMCINQVISPFLSTIVFVNVLLHMGSQAWGKTGASTIGPAPGTVTAAQQESKPIHTWTPRRLANTVRTAIWEPEKPVRPKRRPAYTRTSHIQSRDLRSPSTAQHWSENKEALLALREIGATDNKTTASTSSVDKTNTSPPGISSSSCTPAGRLRQNSHSTPVSLLRRTPHQRRRTALNQGLVSGTPTKAASSRDPLSNLNVHE